MQSVKLKDSVEMVGIAAIVASLIFVGMEMRQSQEIAIASQYQTRTQQNLDFYYAMPEQDFRRIGERTKAQLPTFNLSENDAKRFSEMTPIELGIAWVQIRKIIFIFDNGHYQYQAGFMNEESWQAIRRRTKVFLADSAIAQYEILHRPYQWRDSLVLDLKKMIQDIEGEQ
jgi:hypothetical protein